VCARAHRADCVIVVIVASAAVAVGAAAARMRAQPRPLLRRQRRLRVVAAGLGEGRVVVRLLRLLLHGRKASRDPVAHRLLRLRRPLRLPHAVEVRLVR
jgi:hypothetical protein